MQDVLEALLREVQSGRTAVLATVVRASGSTPRGSGAKALFREDGSSVGTIGGGAFEAMVGADAREMIAGVQDSPKLQRYTFTEEGDDALGMACGGTAEVFLERVQPVERLVIFGAGHVGLALARLASTVGFRAELVDDREEACQTARRQGFAGVFQCDPDYRTGLPDLAAECYVAVVTRCHRTDRLALKQVVHRPVRYLGLIGSRRKKKAVFDHLRREDGATDEELSRVRCPIGLPLGGDSPEEIAVSIVAEMLRERHGLTGSPTVA